MLPVSKEVQGTLPPIISSLAAMGQVLAGFGLNAHGIEICYPAALWDKVRDELGTEEQLRKVDAPLTVSMTAPGLLTPMSIMLKKSHESGLLVTP